jgi:hypothetical protein
MEQYRQERELGTVPGVPLKRPAGGKRNSPLQCDMLIINPPLKGLKGSLRGHYSGRSALKG